MVRPRHSVPPPLRPEQPSVPVRRIVAAIAKAWEFHTDLFLGIAFVVFGWMYFAEKIWRDPIGKYALPLVEVILLLILVYRLRALAGRTAKQLKEFYERYKGEPKPF